MKTVILLLLIICSFNVSAKEVSPDKVHARCASLGIIAGLNKQVITYHIDQAKKTLSFDTFRFHVGYAEGFIKGLVTVDKSQTMKSAAMAMYINACTDNSALEVI